MINSPATMGYMLRPLRPVAALALALTLVGGEVDARERKKRPARDGATFSYYLLSLSYAPAFCGQPVGEKDPRECGSGRHVGFVVHGLWPQADHGRGPEKCGTASPVARDLVNVMLHYIPTESLIQHEWTTHGTCSGLSSTDYFALVRKARDSIRIPDDLNGPTKALRLSPAEAEAKLASANPTFPKGAFRVSCYRDGELQEIRICFNRDLSPRVCSEGAGECPAGSLLLNPVR